ncbi:MAG: hypothetical protein JOZ44_06740 [Acidobacteria bacterium]|nr:hypothetical protein [Acidobacteriota bacterium]
MNNTTPNSASARTDLHSRAALWLFVILCCFYGLASSGRVRTADEYMQFFQAQSLVQRGSTTVPQAVHFEDFYGTYDVHGQPRAPYPAGQALMAAPLLDVARLLLVHFPGVPRTQQAVFYVQAFGAVLTSATCAAGAVALFFLTLLQCGTSIRNALLSALCLGIGTLLFPYSGYFFSEPYTAVVLMAAVYEMAKCERTGSRNSVVIGLLLAFAIWIRPTMVLAVPVFALAILLRERIAGWISAAIVCVLPALSGCGYLLWNRMIFGRALEFGYPNVAEMGKQLNSFHTPFYVGLQGFLFSPGKSIFIFMPPLLLALVGIPGLWRRERALATLAVGLPSIYLLFYMRYTQWEGGLCPGPRYLLPFLCVTCLALGPMLDTGSLKIRRILWVLGSIGLAVQVITYATSFLQDQVVGTYYNANFDYQMSYNPMVSQTLRLISYLKGQHAGLGLGFDRWFVFLHQLGVSASTEVVWALVPLCGLALSITQLRRTLTRLIDGRSVHADSVLQVSV